MSLAEESPLQSTFQGRHTGIHDLHRRSGIHRRDGSNGMDEGRLARAITQQHKVDEHGSHNTSELSTSRALQNLEEFVRR
jgi:hypothetical protein